MMVVFYTKTFRLSETSFNWPKPPPYIFPSALMGASHEVTERDGPQQMFCKRVTGPSLRFAILAVCFQFFSRCHFLNNKNSHLLLIITRDHLIRRFRTPPKQGTKLYRIVKG